MLCIFCIPNVVYLMLYSHLTLELYNFWKEQPEVNSILTCNEINMLRLNIKPHKSRRKTLLKKNYIEFKLEFQKKIPDN